MEDNGGVNEREEAGEGAMGRLSCGTSGRMMLKIRCTPALFRQLKNWIFPDLKVPKWTRQMKYVVRKKERKKISI